ncbi:MAG: hypothetical protein K6E30_04210 [Lachnospiraceae bacterium]|nr:hypothetical protein [Lachnospiraceae bacterium]
MNRRLETSLVRYAESDVYPFHMPGHKRNPDFLRAEALADITEITDFDNLHKPEGILREEMDLAKKLYGTKETFFSVNGSTGALLAAISAAVPRGGSMLIERGCHMSVYHAAYLRDAKLYFLGETEPEKAHALVVSSPTYEGCLKDLPRCAALARRKGAVLIVDEAHGAHLPFCEPYGFPASAIRQGADLVIQSVHKTLPAMTQTALLHNVTGLVENEALSAFLDIYETSSPSYVLLSSITHVLHMAEDRGEMLFSAYAERIRNVRRILSANLRNLKLAGGEEAVLSPEEELFPKVWDSSGESGKDGGMRKSVLDGCRMPGCGKALLLTNGKGTILDPGKLVIRSGPLGGERLFALLRDNYGLELEMKAPGYVLAMTSPADTDEGFLRLISALGEIDENYEFFMKSSQKNRREDRLSNQESEGEDKGAIMEALSAYAAPSESAAPSAYAASADGAVRLGSALESPRERVTLEKAAGRRAAGFVILYPPDVPLIVPGELFTIEKVMHIFQWIKCGYSVIGVERDGVYVEK